MQHPELQGQHEARVCLTSIDRFLCPYRKLRSKPAIRKSQLSSSQTQTSWLAYHKRKLKVWHRWFTYIHTYLDAMDCSRVVHFAPCWTENHEQLQLGVFMIAWPFETWWQPSSGIVMLLHKLHVACCTTRLSKTTQRMRLLVDLVCLSQMSKAHNFSDTFTLKYTRMGEIVLVEGIAVESLAQFSRYSFPESGRSRMECCRTTNHELIA